MHDLGAPNLCLRDGIDKLRERRGLLERGAFLANGFANRFILLATRRTKLLSNPGRPSEQVLGELAKKLARAIEFGFGVGEMSHSPAAAKFYDTVYARLNEPRTGRLHNAVVARSAPQVLRLSMIYALLDGSSTIEVQHLESAIALWDYAERSSKFVFGNSLGDRVAEQVLDLLREAGTSGLMTHDIRAKVSEKKRVSEALRLLAEEGLIRFEEVRKGNTKGRMGQRWFLCQ